MLLDWDLIADLQPQLQRLTSGCFWGAANWEGKKDGKKDCLFRLRLHGVDSTFLDSWPIIILTPCPSDKLFVTLLGVNQMRFRDDCFRKHHCRKCGRCICHSCSPPECMRPLPQLGLMQPCRHCKVGLQGAQLTICMARFVDRCHSDLKFQLTLEAWWGKRHPTKWFEQIRQHSFCSRKWIKWMPAKAHCVHGFLNSFGAKYSFNMAGCQSQHH